MYAMFYYKKHYPGNKITEIKEINKECCTNFKKTFITCLKNHLKFKKKKGKNNKGKRICA